MIPSLLLLGSSLVGLFGEVVSAQTCSTPLDVVFLLDASDSMIDKLTQVSQTMASLVQGYGASRKAQIAIAAFGGEPSLELPLIPKSKDSKSLINGAFASLASRVGSANGFTSQKSGLEALRMILANDGGSALRKRCNMTSFCRLNWRNDAERLVVIVTDDSSDLPIKSAFRMANQDASSSIPGSPIPSSDVSSYSSRPDNVKPGFSPSQWLNLTTGQFIRARSNGTTLKLDSAFQAEVDATAELIRSTSTSVLLISPSTPLSSSVGGYSTWSKSNPLFLTRPSSLYDTLNVAQIQYGHPDAATFINSPSTYASYDLASTKAEMIRLKAESSLAGRLFASSSKFSLFSLESFLRASTGDRVKMTAAAAQLNCSSSSPINPSPLTCASVDESEECFYNGIIVAVRTTTTTVTTTTTTTTVTTPSPVVITSPVARVAVLSSSSSTTSTTVTTPSPVVISSPVAPVAGVLSSSSTTSTTVTTPSPAVITSPVARVAVVPSSSSSSTTSTTVTTPSPAVITSPVARVAVVPSSSSSSTTSTTVTTPSPVVITSPVARVAAASNSTSSTISSSSPAVVTTTVTTTVAPTVFVATSSVPVTSSVKASSSSSVAAVLPTTVASSSSVVSSSAALAASSPAALVSPSLSSATPSSSPSSRPLIIAALAVTSQSSSASSSPSPSITSVSIASAVPTTTKVSSSLPLSTSSVAPSASATVSAVTSSSAKSSATPSPTVSQKASSTSATTSSTAAAAVSSLPTTSNTSADSSSSSSSTSSVAASASPSESGSSSSGSGSSEIPVAAITATGLGVVAASTVIFMKLKPGVKAQMESMSTEADDTNGDADYSQTENTGDAVVFNPPFDPNAPNIDAGGWDTIVHGDDLESGRL